MINKQLRSIPVESHFVSLATWHETKFDFTFLLRLHKMCWMCGKTVQFNSTRHGSIAAGYPFIDFYVFKVTTLTIQHFAYSMHAKTIKSSLYTFFHNRLIDFYFVMAIFLLSHTHTHTNAIFTKSFCPVELNSVQDYLTALCNSWERRW